MVKRKSKKSVARKRIAARKTARAAPRKAKRGYDIHPGQPPAAKSKRCTGYKY